MNVNAFVINTFWETLFLQDDIKSELHSDIEKIYTKNTKKAQRYGFLCYSEYQAIVLSFYMRG